jgi:hypothetical protein
MDGSYAIERCEEVTGSVLHSVLHALLEQSVAEPRLLGRWPSHNVSWPDCSKRFVISAA